MSVYFPTVLYTPLNLSPWFYQFMVANHGFHLPSNPPAVDSQWPRPEAIYFLTELTMGAEGEPYQQQVGREKRGLNPSFRCRGVKADCFFKMAFLLFAVFFWLGRVTRLHSF